MRSRNSYFPNNLNVTILRRRNRNRVPNIVEPELRTIVTPMAERTIEELLRAPTKGYGEAIVLPEINADHFEIKTNLLQLVQANQFYGQENDNPHAHINSFKRITSTLRFRNVPNDVIKLMMFPYSLEGAAKTCEAWERFKELLRACPHHGFTELTQVDTFYNGLNDNEQDSLNSAVGGNLLSKTTREALNIIENKSKWNEKPRRQRIKSKQISKEVSLKSHLWLSYFIPMKLIVPKSLPKTTPILESDIPKSLPKPNIPYPSRRDNQNFADALLLMPRFAPTMKSFLMNNEKLLELAKIPLTRIVQCSSKPPENLGDPGKFLTFINFQGCTSHTWEILFEGRSRVDNEAVTFNLDQTTRYSSTNDKSVNRIDIIDAVCEEYAPEFLGFPNSLGGNPTPTSEPFTSEFILEEIKAYLKDDLISRKIAS
ncbi:reverse transcriptase domain-containing protein [Tanacetum coccineum]